MVHQAKKLIALVLLLALAATGCGDPTGTGNLEGTPDPTVAGTPPPSEPTEPPSSGGETPAASDLEAIDTALQALLFDGKSHEEMGDYVKTTDLFAMEGLGKNGEPTRVVEAFWQCENAVPQDRPGWADGSYWTVRAVVNDGEVLEYDYFPCENDVIVKAKGQANTMAAGNFENARYLLNSVYTALVDEAVFAQNWADVTKDLGTYGGEYTLYYQYDLSPYYPAATVVWHFETGDVFYTYSFTAGSATVADVEFGLFDKDSFELFPQRETQSLESSAQWQGKAAEFTEYDLNAAFDAVALKDLSAGNFLLGAALYGNAVNNCAVNSPEYMAVLKKHFNSTTLTNLMKPSYILDQSASIANLEAGNPEPKLTFDACDPTLQWCLDNGVSLRGHTLVWHNQVPKWFFCEGYQNNGAFVDRDTMIARLESYIAQYINYVQDNYPGVVYCWDVVNEAVGTGADANMDSFFHCRTSYDNTALPNYWYDVLGEDYVELSFRFARKYADEDVALFYNDYGSVEDGKREYIYELCKYLNSLGLIDGIGLQGYWGMSSPTAEKIALAIKEFSTLGLEIQITEFSITPDDETPEGFEKQGARYAEIVHSLTMLDTENGGPANITAVTFFGLMDDFMLYPNDTNRQRFFDKDLQPKPAFHRVSETLELYCN